MSSITRAASKSIIKDKEEDSKKAAKFGRSVSKTDRAFGMSKGLGLGAKPAIEPKASMLQPDGKPFSKPLAPINHADAKQKLEMMSKSKKDTVSIIEEQN